MNTVCLTRPLLMAGLVWVLASCSEGEPQEPLSVNVYENTLLLTYPTPAGGTFTITGGNGEYVVECDSPLFEVEQTSPGVVQISGVRGIGEAGVTIRDGAGHTCRLSVKVGYTTLGGRVVGHDVRIAGDGLTGEEKEAIRADAYATIPAAVQGGYTFTLTGIARPGERAYTGEATLAPEKDADAVRSGLELDDMSSNGLYLELRFAVDGMPRTFHLIQYNIHYLNAIEVRSDSYEVRSISRRPVCLMEDLTERYKAGYPAVGKVYTVQVFSL